MSSFEIKADWLGPAERDDEVQASLARLQIFLNKKNITEYRAPKLKSMHSLSIPAYYLAEWIAENWWVILFEPRKDEATDDSDFTARHSITAAQHGFPLPSLSIMPFGRSIRLNSAPRRAVYANVDFINGAFADMARDEVEETLSKFVHHTVQRLRSCGVTDTPLEEAWEALRSLSDEEREFCELVGSLGVSPSEVTDTLSAALERIYNVLGGRATRDFCLAATAGMLTNSVTLVERIADALSRAKDTKLAPLLSARLPAENYSLPSWRRGMQAAKNIREKFNITISDEKGADKVFEMLNIDTTSDIRITNDGAQDIPYSGAIDRQDSAAKVALLHDDELHRRFGAGRATYLAWVSEAKSRRLVTNAVTRDQQASRSFAAEILIPQAYLTRLAGPKRELRDDQIRAVARERRVMPDVARKQAHNAGIWVGAI